MNTKVLLYDVIRKPVEKLASTEGLLFPSHRIDILIDFIIESMEIYYEKNDFEKGIFRKSIINDKNLKMETAIVSGSKSDILEFVKASVDSKEFDEKLFGILGLKFGTIPLMDDINRIYRQIAKSIVEYIDLSMDFDNTIMMDRTFDYWEDVNYFYLSYITICYDESSDIYSIRFEISKIFDFISDIDMEFQNSFFESRRISECEED